MADPDIDYFPEKIPFRMTVKEEPDRYVYASALFQIINASVQPPDSSSEFYLIEESDGYCRIESAKYRGLFLSQTGHGARVALSHTPDITSSCLFLITSLSDGYFRITRKWDDGSLGLTISLLPPSNLEILHGENVKNVSWKFTAARRPREEVFHLPISTTQGTLPREQHLQTSNSDAIHVVCYSAPSNGNTIADVDLYPGDRSQALQLIANGCVFGKYNFFVTELVCCCKQTYLLLKTNPKFPYMPTLCNKSRFSLTLPETN